MSENFLGENFLVVHLPGGSLMNGNFPGRGENLNFSRTDFFILVISVQLVQSVQSLTEFLFAFSSFSHSRFFSGYVHLVSKQHCLSTISKDEYSKKQLQFQQKYQ